MVTGSVTPILPRLIPDSLGNLCLNKVDCLMNLGSVINDCGDKHYNTVVSGIPNWLMVIWIRLTALRSIVTDHTTSGCRETPVINLLCNLKLCLVCLFWVKAQASSNKLVNWSWTLCAACARDNSG